MSDSSGGRRRPSIHITLQRASRLHGLVQLLTVSPRSRDDVLKQLSIGLRTFYRELDLLKRCGIKIQHKDKLYTLSAASSNPAGRLPFPDPQLSFAEMAELAQCDCEAGKRLASLLASVTQYTGPTLKKKRRTGER